MSVVALRIFYWRAFCVTKTIYGHWDSANESLFMMVYRKTQMCTAAMLKYTFIINIGAHVLLPFKGIIGYL